MGGFEVGQILPHERKTKKVIWVRRILIALLALCAVVSVPMVGAFLWFESLAGSYDLSKLGEMPQRSIVYDREGREVGRLHGENRIIISSTDIPRFFVDALIAREDSRFFRHEGVDIFGVIRAAFVNTVSGELKQGASTITQQLARNSYPLGGQTLQRKIVEALLARRIEASFPKEKILELYANRIYFGSGVFGLETAARAYFGKNARDLSPGESALLVGIIRSPNRFSPYRNLEGALVEREAVLSRMVNERMITQAEADAITDSPIAIAPKPSITRQDNYMMDCVRREFDAILGEEYNGEGGLRIYTTLDLTLQGTAERALENRLSALEFSRGWEHPTRSQHVADGDIETPTTYVQGAAVVIHNETGGILAAVGGRDYLQSKVNRAIATFRQIGSAMKPFVYAAAFERGMLPGMLVSDDPIAAGEIAALPTPWTPENSDGRYNGLLPLEIGLIRSRNTMSVRVGEMAGLTEVRRVATLAGVAPWLPIQPSIYLGAFESSVKDVAAAYAVFPNGGKRKQAYLIERIDDDVGQPLFLAAHIELQAIKPGAAWMTHTCLEEVMTRGTAARAKELGLAAKAAGKTGTTNEFRDAWFAGYTTSITCAVWVGMDRPATIMSRGYGSTLALPIWVDIINAATTSRYPARDFVPPVPLTEMRVCRVTGLRATKSCDTVGSAYTVEIPESQAPAGVCHLHEGVVPPREPHDERRPNFFQRLFGSGRRERVKSAVAAESEDSWSDD